MLKEWLLQTLLGTHRISDGAESRPLAGSNWAPRAAGNRSYQRPMHFQSAHLGCFLVAIFAPSVHKIINQQACEQNSHRRKCRGKNHVGELKSGLYWCQVNNLSAFGMGHDHQPLLGSHRITDGAQSHPSVTGIQLAGDEQSANL